MIQIFIKRACGSTAVLDGLHLDSPVESLKAHIRDIERDSFFIVNGKILHTNVSLRSYGLQNGSTIFEHLKMVGGVKLGKFVKGRSQAKEDEETRGSDNYTNEENAEAVDDSYNIEEIRKRLTSEKQSELKKKLEAEVEISRVNSLKIQNQWRNTMRLSKVKILKHDMEVLKQSHERNVERKDALLQLLDRELEESEDQYQVALGMHMDCVDELIAIHQLRMATLNDKFLNNVQEIKQVFHAEICDANTRHQKQKAEILDITAASKRNEADWEAEVKAGQEQASEELRNKNLEEVNILHITLDSQIEELERQFEAAHVAYLQVNDQRTSEFKRLTVRNKEMGFEIELKKRKIEALQRNLSKVKGKMSTFEKESERQNMRLMNQKRSIQAKTSRLREKMTRDRDSQKKKLIRLSLDAKAAKDHLTEHVALAERILVLAEIARKAETEFEQASPFEQAIQRSRVRLGEATLEETNYDASSSTSHTRNSMSRDSTGVDLLEACGDETHHLRPTTRNVGYLSTLSSGSESKDESRHSNQWQELSNARNASGFSVKREECLRNFHSKMNKALADCMKLVSLEEKLSKENEQLKALIQHFDASVSVQSDAVAAANPLLVVNGRVNLTMDEMRRSVGPVIDAHHMVITGRVNTIEPL